MPFQSQTQDYLNIDKLYQLFQVPGAPPVNPVAVKLAYGVDLDLRDVKITKVGNNYRVDWRPRKPSDPTRSFEIDGSGAVTSAGGKDQSSRRMIEAINSYSRTIDSKNFENLDVLFKDLASGSKIRVPYTEALAQTDYEITLTINPDRTVRYDFQEIPNNPASTVGFSILRDTTSGKYKIQNVGVGLRAADLAAQNRGYVATAWQNTKNLIFRNRRVAALPHVLNTSNSIKLPFLQSLMQDVQTSSHSVAVDRASIGGNDRIKQLFEEAKKALLGKSDNGEFFIVGNATPNAINEISITKIASDRDQNATKIRFKYHDGANVVEFDVEMKDGKCLVGGVNAAHDPNFTNPVKAIRDLMTGSGNPLNLTEKIKEKRLSDETLKKVQKEIFGKIDNFLKKYPNNPNLDLGNNQRVIKVGPTQFRIVLSNAANDSIIVTRNAKGDFNYEPHHAKPEYKSNPSLFQDHLLEIEKKFEEIEAHKDTPYNELVGIGVSNELQAVILGEKKLELAKRFLQVNEKVADAGYTDYQDGRTKKRVYVEEDGDNLVFRAIILTDAIKQGEKNLSSLRELQASDEQLRRAIQEKIQEAQVARRGRDRDPLIELAQAVIDANNDARAAAVRAVEGRYDEIFGQIQDAQGRIERNQQEISKNSAQQRLIDAQIGKLEGEIRIKEIQKRQQEIQFKKLQDKQFQSVGGTRVGTGLESGGFSEARPVEPATLGSQTYGAPYSVPSLEQELAALKARVQELEDQKTTLKERAAELEGTKKTQKAALTPLQESLKRIREVLDLSNRLQEVNAQASRIRGDRANIAEKIDAEQQAVDAAIVAQKQHASARNFKLNTRNFEIKHVQGQADAPANINRDFDAQASISEYLIIANAISPQRAVATSFAASRGNEAAPRGHDAVEFSAAADPRAATTEFRGHGAASREYGAAYYRGHDEAASRGHEAPPRDASYAGRRFASAATAYGQSATTVPYGGSRFSSAATPHVQSAAAHSATAVPSRAVTAFSATAAASQGSRFASATAASSSAAPLRGRGQLEPLTGLRRGTAAVNAAGESHTGGMTGGRS